MSDIAQKLARTVIRGLRSIYIFPPLFIESHNYISKQNAFTLWRWCGHDGGGVYLFAVTIHRLRIEIVCSMDCTPLRACHWSYIYIYMEKRYDTLKCSVRWKMRQIEKERETERWLEREREKIWARKKACVSWAHTHCFFATDCCNLGTQVTKSKTHTGA